MYGLTSVLDGGCLFCGVTEEQFAINGVTYQWPRSIVKLKWSVDFSRIGQLSDMDFKDAATTWLQEISQCCNRVYEYVSNQRLANILYTQRRLDGQSGVLAQHQIPTGNVTPDTQLTCVFDDSENFVLADTPQNGQIDIYRVGLHEALHGEGLGHKPVNISDPALIAPTYNPFIRHLQDADKKELVRRNGLPTTAPPPKRKKMLVTATLDGVVWGGELLPQ